MDLKNIDEVRFDFRACSFGEPLPLMLLAREIKRLHDRFPGKRFILIPGKSDFHGYADHIGFFRYIGWSRGREPGEAWGSGSYIPIEQFDIKELQTASQGGPVGAVINTEAEKLANVLAQADDGPLFNVFQYALREIMRNSAEHSCGNKLAVLAQYWPTKHKAEIVIHDDGIGVPSSLYDNEFVECNDPRQALKCALLPGISGVPRSVRSTQDEYWGNSGFGLYVTSRICAENGFFRLISDSQGITLRSTTQIEHDWQFQGTCVQMILHSGSAVAIEKSIPEIISEGERRRSELMESFPLQASAASKMLASQYRKLKQGV